MKYVALLSLLVACAKPHASRPFPAFPDTLYTNSGATPIYVVDSIIGQDSTQLIVGRYQFFDRRVLLWRGVTDEKQRRKVLEHERVHVILIETGLAMHMREVPWLIELIADAIASARIAELERTRP